MVEDQEVCVFFSSRSNAHAGLRASLCSMVGSVVCSMVLVLASQAQAATTIPQMWDQQFGSGAFKVVKTLEKNSQFTRYLIEYPSEGLKLQGFVNVPNKTAHQVVIMLHGYVNPSGYKLLTYTTRYADDLARSGFIVFHPNFRGHGSSEGKADSDAFRSDYVRDTLNLVGQIRKQKGKGILKNFNGNIGLWGHSMGGGVALKTLVTDPRIKAAVLYAPMSGDEAKNLKRIQMWSGGTRGKELSRVPSKTLAQHSALNHLENVSTAIRVYHGTKDQEVPYLWSKELCEKSKGLGLYIRCTSYANAGHLFSGKTDQAFRADVKLFFKQHL